MIELISRLRPVDQILIWGFAVYAIFIVAAWIYLERERIRNGQRRTINGMILHLQMLTRAIRGDAEDYDPRWMDSKKYREAKRND